MLEDPHQESMMGECMFQTEKTAGVRFSKIMDHLWGNGKELLLLE